MQLESHEEKNIRTLPHRSPDTVTIGGHPGKLAHQRRSHAEAKRRLRQREHDEMLLLQFPVRKATLRFCCMAGCATRS